MKKKIFSIVSIIFLFWSSKSIAQPSVKEGVSTSIEVVYPVIFKVGSADSKLEAPVENFEGVGLFSIIDRPLREQATLKIGVTLPVVGEGKTTGGQLQAHHDEMGFVSIEKYPLQQAPAPRAVLELNRVEKYVPYARKAAESANLAEAKGKVLSLGAEEAAPVGADISIDAGTDAVPVLANPITSGRKNSLLNPEFARPSNQSPSEDFDSDGMAKTNRAKKVAVIVYQEAINRFIAGVENHGLGKEIEMKVLHLFGSLVLEGNRMGIFPKEVSFEQARKLVEHKTAGSVSRHPADVDLSMHQSITLKSNRPEVDRRAESRNALYKMYSLINEIRENIFEQLGVFIHLHGPHGFPNQFNRRVIDAKEIRRNGLIRHMHIVDMLGGDAKRVQITSRDFELVVHQLAFSGKEIENLRGKRLLSVGEGASNFAQTLENKGVRATALDWWYALTANEIERHIHVDGGRDGKGGTDHAGMSASTALERLPSRTVAGKLPNLPFADKTFDEVVSSNLIYWFLGREKYKEMAMESIRELIRVTRPGGEIRFNLNSSVYMGEVENLLKREYPEFSSEKRSGVLMIHVADNKR